MRIRVNGTEVQEAEPSIASVLQRRGVPPESVAVALNGTIVPRDRWTAALLREDDELEVVHVVAGGSAALDPPHPLYRPEDDPLVIAGRTFTSRLILGSSKFPTPDVMVEAWERSGTQMVTVAIRYMNLDEGGHGSVLPYIDRGRIELLPNTAGAATAAQAVRMAHLAREAAGTPWIKLEVIGESTYLWPDVAATIEATATLVREGFVVLPYTSGDLVAALRLEEAGAATVMPLASPIGSGQGFIDWTSITRIIERVTVPVIVDAGIGVPSDAAVAMELGAAAVLTNTAIARASRPAMMAEAMKRAVIAGRLARLAGRMPKRDTAEPSSPPAGIPPAAIRHA